VVKRFETQELAEICVGECIFHADQARANMSARLLTSNKSLTEWATITHDVSLASAIIDRLLHHGEVFYLNGPSWRLKGRSPDPASDTEGSS